MNDLISRQAAIDAANRADYTGLAVEDVKAVTDEVVKELKKLPSAERREQITSEMDETFRIASEIRLAVGCNTSRECWELARKGDINRVKHGRWIDVEPAPHNLFYATCSVCGDRQTIEVANYCPMCGASMDEVNE